MAPPPESIAIEWLESYESGDVAHYQSLMSADATFLADDGYDRAIADYFAEGGVGGANQDARDSRLLALANGSLNAVCSAENNLVSCDTMRISEFGYFTADGEPTQVDTSSYEFTIDDGVITHLTLTRFGGNLFDYGQVQGYRIWLAETHPTAHDELFFQSTILLTTEDQFEQHKTYVVEYLNSR